MFNSSSALPQSSNFLCEFCNSTTYVYCKFSANSEAIYFENDVETSQSSDNQEDRQILPNTPESERSFNPFMVETPEVNRSEVAGVNSKKGFSASSNKRQPEMYPAANDVMYKPLKRSTNNINVENNVADCSKQLDVQKAGVKRKLFDEIKPAIPPKKTAPKSKIVQDEAYKFLPELSDSIADNFLQQFDREIAFGSVRKSGDNSTECFPKVKLEDLSIQCNLDNHKNLPKRRADQRLPKAVPLLKEESFSNDNRDINIDINQSDLTSTSEESNNTNQTESTEKNNNKDNQKKINVLVGDYSGSSVSSDDSVSSIASTVSRYGRIRKPSSVYVNATMFKGSATEIKQKASTLINSHTCQNGSSRSFEATSSYCPDQLDILTQTHAKMVSPQFKRTATKITSSKNRQTTREFQNSTRNSSWRNSSFIEELPELLRNKKKLPELQKLLRQTTPSAAESNYIDEKLGLPNRTLTPSALISDYPEQLNLNIQSPLCSQCKKSKALIPDHSSEEEIFKKPLAKNVSPKSQKIVIDDCEKPLDPNEIHAVVKDEVVSFKWYSATPDLESVLGKGVNVYYSMRDLKSFYTNLTVGYLKIDAGHKKPLTVLKDYILLYFVERGEGIFQVSGRKIAGQIGSTVFIPLGVEYSIKNSSTEEDFILKFVIISPSI